MDDLEWEWLKGFVVGALLMFFAMLLVVRETERIYSTPQHEEPVRVLKETR